MFLVRAVVYSTLRMVEPDESGKRFLKVCHPDRIQDWIYKRVGKQQNLANAARTSKCYVGKLLCQLHLQECEEHVG